MSLDLLALKQSVQNNCHIADAAAAGDYTLCIYLLKMREFYRWESGHNYKDNLGREEVGNWLREREQLWEDIQDQQFAKLPVNGAYYDPFDSNAINAALMPQHLVYSGGYGRYIKPHFFLGVLERYERHGEFEIYVSADEYARDLTAPPAMSQGKTIYIRREALHRMIWEKYEQWLWNKPDNALKRALEFYNFDGDLEQALNAMTNHELDSVLLHEIGEVKCHEILGDSWEELLLELPHSKLELMLRAIRDHMADALSTLPKLIADHNAASLHFYIANLSNLRKDLFPSLSQAYQSWHESGNMAPLTQTVDKAAQHWRDLCQKVLDVKAQHPEGYQALMLETIEAQRL